jgi:ubiquinone/menaquinone biosynthesis C-methylase UbiE
MTRPAVGSGNFLGAFRSRRPAREHLTLSGMSDDTFTPALGRLAPARFFDVVVALTRERLWRSLTVAHVAPRPGDIIADVGCGTGTLATLISDIEPQAQVIGVDPDPEVLHVARRKSADSSVQWRQGMGNALTETLGDESVTAVVSSLVLHQCPVPMKEAILASMFGALRPGGRLVIADYGKQRTTLMRLAFRIVQLADGKSDTQPNADGIVPDLITAAGFRDVREAQVVSTVTGSLSIYVARK